MSEFGRVLHEGRETWVVAGGGELVPCSGPPWDGGAPRAGGLALDPSRVTWLPPVAPSKIVGIGRNYAMHAEEHGAEVPKEPLLFLKAPTSLLAAGEDVPLPPESARVEFEGELAVLIGARVRRFREDGDLGAVIAGWAAANDVTARDLQRADGQWARGKSFDGFCPIGRLATTTAPAPDARIETRVNGQLRQSARLSDLVFKVARLVAHASAAMTLLPGDVILTGTPGGVGPLAEGDRVEVSIEGVPPLWHGVRRETT